MPEKEIDRREEIIDLALRSLVLRVPAKDVIENAMDEYMKECCLALLEFMAKNKVDVDCDYPDSKINFHYKGGWITKEQLFENFL